MARERESYALVMLYMIGQLDLTHFPRLTTQERYTFSPRGHAADTIARVQEEWIVDQLKLEDMDHAD